MVTKRIRQFLLMMVTVLLGTGIADAECKMQMVLIMPITMAGTQPLVTVKLDGVEAHMLLDTGSFFSFLSPETAKRAGLSLRSAPEHVMVQGITGAAERPDETTVKEFVIGTQTLRRVDLLVFGDRFGNADGILGQNFLRLGDIEIDLANGVAKLFKDVGCEHANLAYWGGSSQVSVLDILPTEQGQSNIIADAKVNDTDIRVMFDTGASASSLSLHAAEKAGITPQSPGVVSGGVRAGLGRATQDSWIAPFKSFKLDSEETLNTRLRIGDLRRLPRSADMLLGADFFLSHHIFIAYGQNKLFFTYNGGPVFDLRIQGAAQVANTGQAAGPTSTTGPADAAASPVNGADFDRRADASVARGEIPAAIADYGQAIAADPNNAEYRLHRAVALARSGDPRQAIVDLDEAVRLRPGFADALMLRATIRIRNGNIDGARADFAAAEASAPDRYELQLQEAAAYTSTSRYPLALDLLNRWIAAHPQDQRRYDALGERCLVRGMLGKDLDAALSDCDTAHFNLSGNSQVLCNRGIVQLRRKEYAKAISDLSDAIKLQPRFAVALYARGLAENAKGDRAGGDADLKAALAIAPRVANMFRGIDLGS